MLLSRRTRPLAVGVAFSLAVACSSDNGTDPGPDTTPAAITVVGGNGQSGTTGGALGNPFVAQVTNADGDPLQGITVQWSVVAGGGSLGSASTPTNAQGRAEVTYTLGAAGPNTVRATVAGTSLTTTFTATANAPVDPTPASIDISDGNNQSGIRGDPLDAPFAIVVRNAALQVLSGVTISWTVIQGGGSLGAATSVTNAQGVATVTYTLGPNTGTNTVDAAVESDPSLEETFTATANAPPANAAVSVEDSFFDPNAVTVATSGTVTWMWSGALDHNVTWVSAGFQNSPTQPSGNHQVTFADAGTFDYYCTIHGTPTGGMRGSVTVK